MRTLRWAALVLAITGATAAHARAQSASGSVLVTARVLPPPARVSVEVPRNATGAVSTKAGDVILNVDAPGAWVVRAAWKGQAASLYRRASSGGARSIATSAPSAPVLVEQEARFQGIGPRTLTIPALRAVRQRPDTILVVVAFQ